MSLFRQRCGLTFLKLLFYLHIFFKKEKCAKVTAVQPRQICSDAQNMWVFVKTLPESTGDRSRQISYACIYMGCTNSRDVSAARMYMNCSTSCIYLMQWISRFLHTGPTNKQPKAYVSISSQPQGGSIVQPRSTCFACIRFPAGTFTKNGSHTEGLGKIFLCLRSWRDAAEKMLSCKQGTTVLSL